MRQRKLRPYLEVTRRRPLSPAEAEEVRRALAGSPEELAAWEQEQRLSLVLGHLPEARVPSNFTAQVLQAIDRVGPPPVWRRLLRLPWPSWIPAMPRVAMAAALVLTLTLGYLWQRTDRRTHLAESVTHLARSLEGTAELARMPTADILQDFDAIDHLRHAAAMPDEDLLAQLAPSGRP